MNEIPARNPTPLDLNFDPPAGGGGRQVGRSAMTEILHDGLGAGADKEFGIDGVQLRADGSGEPLTSCWGIYSGIVRCASSAFSNPSVSLTRRFKVNLRDRR
jgi:hypothetical protein